MPVRSSQGRVGRLKPVALLCALALGPGVWAGTNRPAPSGLTLGKLVFTPFVWTTYAVENNIFRQDDASSPSSDRVNNLGLGTWATLPFRMSYFSFGAEAIKRTYEINSFTRDTDLSLDADLQLHFSSFDTVNVRTSYYSGFTDVSRFGEGGEQVFDGEPFAQLRTDFEVLRGVANEAGYYLRASRITLRYDDAANTAFYDYDGWDFSGEYRHPFSSYKWLVVYGNYRDFDHEVPATNELFRHENATTLQLGLRGMLGKDQPFVIRVGYGTLDYEFPDGSEPNTEFAGVTAHARWSVRVGGRSTVDFAVDRRPLPSNFDTSYVNTRIFSEFRRPITRNSGFAVALAYDDNNYADPIVVNGCNVVNGQPQPFSRQDKRHDVGAQFNWQLGRYVSYRMDLGLETRNSTCDVFTYSATTLSAGVVVGWF